SKNLVAVRIHPGNITADRVEMFSGALSVIEKNMVDLPSEYMDTAVSTKKRLANILGVVRVAAGDKKRGRLALLREFQAGDFRAVFYLLLSLLPLWALNNGINWYGKKQLTRVK
ncbi:MAG: hypothetical protein ACE5FU_13690, partial [Nitrospinota bacterium]